MTSERFAGRYALLRRLGRGGMGEVFLARDLATGAECALKRLHTSGEPALTDSLRREYEALTRIRHPAVVSVHGFGVAPDGTTYLTMEYVPGLPADRAIRVGDWRALCSVGAGVAEGLEALHDIGVVHGDLKPSNLLVIGEPGGAGAPGGVRLLDFGLASLVRSDGAGHRGTAGFAAPEVVAGAAPEPRSDLYGLGVTMYVLLTGVMPFAGEAADERLRSQQERAPRARALEDYAAPRPLVELILRLMANQPAERPESARTVRREIERIHPAARRSLVERMSAASVVGRERELARLESWLDRVPASPPMLVACGEAGAGKSALLSELAARSALAGRDLLQLNGGALEGPGAAALAIAKALAALCVNGAADTDPDRRFLAPDATLRESDLDALAEAAAAWARDRRDPRAVLVLLDDADRLDALSMAWIRRVGLRPDATPLRWVLARRGPVAALDEHERLLFDAGAAAPIALPPLKEEDVERLAASRLRAPVPRELKEWLLRRGEGHPGLTVELLFAAAREAIVEHEAGLRVDAARLEALEAPRDFERQVLERLSRLAPEARAALEALAVAGSGLGPGDLQRLAPEAGARAWEELIAAGVVTQEADGRLALKPAALDAALLAGLSEARRRALHRTALEIPGLSPRQCFRHACALGEIEAALQHAERAFAVDPDPRLAAEAAALAEPVEPERAAAWHERAALRHRARGRYRDAVAPLERALALDASPAPRPARWALLSTAALRSGAPDEVVRVVEQALAEPLDEVSRAVLLVNRGMAEAALGREADAERSTRTALALAEASGDRVAVGTAAEALAHFHFQRRELDQVETLAARAAAAYRLAAHPVGLVRAIGTRGSVAQLRHRFGDAERLFGEAVASARTLENRLALSEQLLQLSAVRAEAGRWGLMLEPIAEAGRVAIEDGRPFEASAAMVTRAHIEGLGGRPRDARRSARLGLRMCTRFRRDLLAYAGRALAQSERLLGRRGAAERAARRALERARAGDHEESRWCRLELGRTLVERGAWDEAAACWGAAPGALEPPQTLAGAMLAVWLGRAAARVGDLGGAERRAEQVEAWLAGHPAPWPAAMVQILRAHVGFARGKFRPALEAAWAGLAKLDALPAPLERALAAFDLAQSAPVAPELHAPVCEWLDGAALAFERCGDRRHREQALALAVEWLRRPSPTTPVARDHGLIDRVTWLLSSLTDLQELSRRAMQAAVDTLDAERGVLLLADPETGQLAPMAEYGAIEAATRLEAMTFSRRVVQHVAESGGSLVIQDAPTDPRAASESVATLRLRSILCVPMFLGGKTVGAVYLDDSRRKNAFGAAERALLEGFAHLMAVAIEKSRGHEEVQRVNELLEGENLSLRREIGARLRAHGVIGNSAPIQRVLGMVEHAARSVATVLITGESGTGKELVARTLHHTSRRHMKPFVAVNCGAIPKELLESELFGILSDVATGVRARPGKFVHAHGGTLFLDEIGEMPLNQQVALLAAIANREITPVGSAKPIPVDVRIIAATNQDLRRLVSEKKFREDLFYRLNVIEIEVPPLRERKSDLPALVQHFVEQFARQQERPVPELSSDFLAALMQSDWRGNVRELQNYIERVMAMTPGPVLHPDPPPRQLERRGDTLRGARSRPLFDAIAEIEIRLIREALERAEGNQSRAARELGLTEQAVRYKLKKYGIDGARQILRMRRTSRL